MNDNLFIKDRHSFKNQLTFTLGLSIACHVLIVAFLLIMGGYAPHHLARQLGQVITVSMVSVAQTQSEGREQHLLSGGNKPYKEKREVLSAKEMAELQDEKKIVVTKTDLSRSQATVNVTPLALDSRGDKVREGTSKGSTNSNADGQMIAPFPSGAGDKGNFAGVITDTASSWPRYKANDQPNYPMFARLRGYEGTVLLAAEIMSSGCVGRIMVKTSSGYEALDHSALVAVKKWIFEPAMQQGVPVAMWVEIPIRFSLNNIND